MSTYQTEEEQIEAIKTWWRKYSNLITVGLSAVLLAIASYKYWNWHVEKTTIQASSLYENMMMSYSNQDNNSTKGYANELIQSYNNTVYAGAASLLKAKMAVDKRQFDEASSLLSELCSTSRHENIKAIAGIRLSRIQLAQNKYSEALVTLKSLDNTPFKAIALEIKGDVYRALGNNKEAALAYKQASSQTKKVGIGNAFLDMKAHDIATLSKPNAGIKQTDKNIA